MNWRVRAYCYGTDGIANVMEMAGAETEKEALFDARSARKNASFAYKVSIYNDGKMVYAWGRARPTGRWKREWPRPSARVKPSALHEPA